MVTKRKKPDLLECLNKKDLDRFELDMIMMGNSEE